MKRKKVDFKTLQKQWYGKLKKNGFEDIESDEDNLKVWSTVFFAKHSLEQIKAKQSYYQMASNFLADYKFDTKLDKVIWEYHTNGISVREIETLLKKVKIKMNFMSIWRVVSRNRSKMYDMYMFAKKAYHE